MSWAKGVWFKSEGCGLLLYSHKEAFCRIRPQPFTDLDRGSLQNSLVRSSETPYKERHNVSGWGTLFTADSKHAVWILLRILDTFTHLHKFQKLIQVKFQLTAQ